MKQIKYYIFPFIFLLNIYILFFQSNWLGVAIINNPPLPLGTLISWLSIAILPWYVYIIFPSKRKNKFENRVKNVLKIFVVFGFLWGVFSRVLSGNWTWTFQNKNLFYIWLIFTAILVVVPLFILVLFIVRRIIQK